MLSSKLQLSGCVSILNKHSARGQMIPSGKEKKKSNSMQLSKSFSKVESSTLG